MIVESFQKSVLCARSWPIASDGKCAFMDLLEFKVKESNTQKMFAKSL